MNTPNVANEKLMWYVLIHLTFVASAFGVGVLDRVTRREPVPSKGP